jgi:hypothetical protein
LSTCDFERVASSDRSLLARLRLPGPIMETRMNDPHLVLKEFDSIEVFSVASFAIDLDILGR